MTVVLAVNAMAGADYSAFVIFIPQFSVAGVVVCCMTCFICCVRAPGDEDIGEHFEDISEHFVCSFVILSSFVVCRFGCFVVVCRFGCFVFVSVADPKLYGMYLKYICCRRP